MMLVVRQTKHYSDNKMNIVLIKKYSLNCFLLMLPIMLWNILLTKRLPKDFQPEIFWKDISPYLMYGENISRTIIFLLTLLMPLSISNITQKKGLFLYLGGTILYFASWLVLIYFPNSSWSNNLLGFMAPAYTPLLWLTGIALIGNSFYFNFVYKRWIFILTSIIFLLLHNFHAITIFFRNH
jgi:hypothetical protein